jgi:peptidoglycan/xylan/chitin deacetylase (PgdA/CDA1 family)
MVDVRLTQPVISFSFDDFPASAYTCAGAILKGHGFSATYYVSLGLLGTESPTGRIIGAEDLANVLADGHELGCHTYAHSHAWDTPPAVFETSVRDNARELASLCPHARFKTLSYPISCPHPAIKRRCAKYFFGCRAGGQTYNSGAVDLNNLRAFFLEQSRDNIGAIKQVIDTNCRACGWLILVTHDVSDNPTRFGCQPALFEKIVTYATMSQAQIVPVSSALRLAGAANP